MEALIPGLPDDLAEECLIRVAFDHLFIIDSVCPRWRDAVRSPYFHSRRRLAGVTRRILVVIQKVHNNECYHGLTLFDPVSSTWRSLPPIPNIWTDKPLIEVKVVGVGRLLVAIGRHHPSSVSIYDCLTSAWREGSSLPGKKRARFSLLSDGIKKVYVAGGQGPEFRYQYPVRSVLCYDVEEDRWETFSDLAGAGRPLFDRSAFQKGKLYLMKQKYARKCITNVYDVSSHDSYVADTVDEMKAEFWNNTYDCAFAPDGKIFCSKRGEKLKVREDEKWRELADLPYDIDRLGKFCCWDGGVIIISLNYDEGRYWMGSHKMYTFMLQDQNLSWKLHEMPGKGWIDLLTWLDI